MGSPGLRIRLPGGHDLDGSRMPDLEEYQRRGSRPVDRDVHFDFEIVVDVGERIALGPNGEYAFAGARVEPDDGLILLRYAEPQAAENAQRSDPELVDVS